MVWAEFLCRIHDTFSLLFLVSKTFLFLAKLALLTSGPVRMKLEKRLFSSSCFSPCRPLLFSCQSAMLLFTHGGQGKVRPLATKTLFNLINWISQASSLSLENEAVWKWMELDNTRLSEQVPARKGRPQMFSVLCGPWFLSLTGSRFWWERVWRGQKVTGAARRGKEALGRWARRAAGPVWQERTERYWRAGVMWGWKHGDREATKNKYVWKCYKRR